MAEVSDVVRDEKGEGRAPVFPTWVDVCALIVLAGESLASVSRPFMCVRERDPSMG